MKTVEIRHGHIFCGLGGGAKGFNRGQARMGNLRAKFRCIGGIDNSAAAIHDFSRFAGVPGTLADLFSLEQYIAFNGKKPEPGWREFGLDDFRKAFGYEVPHILFLSAPCKGFSGLLSEARSKTGKYQALNQLALRGLWMAMESWKDDPPELILFENVPRIQNRGRHLLDQIVSMLQAYGYATAETTHDCGELGNLGQSRKRFLLVARHVKKVPAFLYEPVKHPLRAVGDVLDKFPMPADPAAGPMHRLPALQWKTWVRLAFVEAGSDWRSLQKLNVVDGKLADYLIMPEYRNGLLGVTDWQESAGTVAGESKPTNGKFSVADPRFDGHAYGQYGVTPWQEHSSTMTSQRSPGQGKFSVADPRFPHGPSGPHFANVYRVVKWNAVGPTVTTGKSPSSSGIAVADPRHAGPAKHSNEYRIVGWDRSAQAVTSAHGTGQAVADPRTGYSDRSPNQNKLAVTDWDGPCKTVTGANQPQRGALSVADPRSHSSFKGKGKYQVTPFNAHAATVISGSTTGHGAFAVADPRPAWERQKGDHYLTGGHFGVIPWAASANTVAGTARQDNGFNSVADPRELVMHPFEGLWRLPEAADQVVCVIRALDNTWHRPFTTLELAALQGLVEPEEFLELYGLSDSAWRERIGNAVPPPTAEAIAGVMGRALLGAWNGETFKLSAEKIWVQPIAVALSVQTP